MTEEKGAAAAPGTDTDLLLFAVVILVVVVGIESFGIAWYLNRVASETERIAAQPDRLLAFVKAAALVFFPMAALNAALGTYIARGLSLPLGRVRAAMSEVARGNLEHELALPPGGFLRGYAEECQKMLQTLRRLLYRDHQSVVDAGVLLQQCQALLSRGEADGPVDRKKVVELLNQARAELSVINHHFTKGRRERL